MRIFGSIFGKSSKNETLSKLITDGAFLVDVRSPKEFAESNVEGSINIPLDQVQNQLAKFKGKESTVVFCRSGNRSGLAKLILERNGFTNVINGGTWLTVNQLINQ